MTRTFLLSLRPNLPQQPQPHSQLRCCSRAMPPLPFPCCPQGSCAIYSVCLGHSPLLTSPLSFYNSLSKSHLLNELTQTPAHLNFQSTFPRSSLSCPVFHRTSHTIYFAYLLCVFSTH